MTVPTNPTCNIQIAMDTATVKALKGSGFNLYAFLGAGFEFAVKPLLWFSSQEFGETTEVSWTPQVQVFVSSSEIAPNGLIVPSSSIDVVGRRVTIGPSQQLTREAGLYHIWFQRWPGSPSGTGGLSQLIQGQYNPHCAFDFRAPGDDGPYNLLMRPIPKVVLMIAVDTVKIGTVVLSAFANGVCVDLTDQEAVHSAKVKYDVNSHWSWTSADNPGLNSAAITAVTTNQDLAALLTLQLPQDGVVLTP